MKRINGYTRIFGKMMPYCIEFEDCYDIVKRNGGWSIKKDGEFIDNYSYCSKWVAASKIGKFVDC
jgi:hypothetical protein